jgi:hypothetical protein
MKFSPTLGVTSETYPLTGEVGEVTGSLEREVGYTYVGIQKVLDTIVRMQSVNVDHEQE